ncbi:MAG: hypothetical protein WCE30_25905 [Mycobacterium sp.]
MPPPLGLVNLSTADLIAAAGGDPWKLNDELQTGDPGAINAQADAFHTAAGSATEVEDDFKSAKQRFEKGWRHNGSENPINESAEVTRATDQLHLQKPQLAKIALDLENIATALSTAKNTCDADISALDTFLHGIDDAIGNAKANNQDTKEFHDVAVAAVRTSLGDVQTGRNGYIAAMAAAKPSLDTAAGQQVIGPAGQGPPVGKPDPNGSLIGPGAGGPPGEKKPPWWQPSPGEVAIGGSGAIAGVTADGVRGAVLNAIKDGPKTGPGAPDPGLLKWLEDPKYRMFKGFSKIGGVASLVGVIPSIASDMAPGEGGKPGDSFAKAATREVGGAAIGIGTGAATGFIAEMGTAAAIGFVAGSEVPVVGNVVGLVVGAAVGAYIATDASKGISEAWDWAASGVKSIFSW